MRCKNSAISLRRTKRSSSLRSRTSTRRRAFSGSDSSRASLSNQWRLPVISQTAEQPRVPPLRTVVADRDAQRLLLPDQHEQTLAPRDPRVDQVPLQEHVVLRGKRDHYCRELRSLRLVDRDRVNQRNLVQFPEVVLDQPIVEAHGDLLLDEIDPLNDPHVAI